MNRDFPGVTFYFLPADIVSQTLNFGIPAPLDIQVVGRNETVDQQVANSIAQKIRQVRGAVDVRVQQPNDLQRLEFNVDRTKAMELGLTERDVAGSVLLALSGSSQVATTYWLDPTTGVQYLVNVRVPERQTTTLAELRSMPLSASKPGTGNAQILDNVTDITRITSQPIYTHYNVIPVVDVYGGVGGRDLGGVLSDIKPIVAQAQKTAPQGVSIVLRGQASTMSSSFLGLGVGMLVAIALIYLLLVVNFQSWLDPFIILTALTGALAGVIWGLHVTSTTLSVPAMMGAIMCLGVATANSVLVVTFARTHLEEGMDSVKAAWEAGHRTFASSDHDSDGDDHRNVADGAWSWRRRRAERAARPGGNRRSHARHRRHATFCSRSVQPFAPTTSRSLASQNRKKMFHQRPLRSPFPQPKHIPLIYEHNRLSRRRRAWLRRT